MGMDAYAELVLGCEVEHADLFDEQTAVFTKCSACPGELERGSKFCGYCGHKFVPETRRQWKPQVFEVLRKKWRRLEIGNTARDYWDAPLFSTDEDEIFIGHQLSHVNCSYDKEVRQITFGGIDRAREQVNTLLLDMGLGQRDLSLLQFTRIY